MSRGSMGLCTGGGNYAFILRLWRESPALGRRPAVWRLSLTDVCTRTHKVFGSLEELVVFLQTRTAHDDAPFESQEEES